MASEPCVSLTVPGSIMVRTHKSSSLWIQCNPLFYFCFIPLFLLKNKKRGKAEEVQRKVGVVLLNGQKLELTCDIKAVCKDVLDMVVAHTGLVEHHLFGLAYLKGKFFTVLCSLFLCFWWEKFYFSCVFEALYSLYLLSFIIIVKRVGLIKQSVFFHAKKFDQQASLLNPTDNEFFFVDPDAKLTKVAPEGWKEEPKKRRSDVPFNLFFRIKFFLDDVNFIL